MNPCTRCVHPMHLKPHTCAKWRILSPAPDSPSASGTPAEVDGQSSGPQSARADSVGGAS